MARNNFILGQSGVDIDLQGATIHNYNNNWVGDTSQTGPVAGISVAYGVGDMVYYNMSLWLAVAASDNVEPGSDSTIWEEITTGGGASIARWSNSPGIYQTDDIVIYVRNGQAELYIWEGANPSTPTDIPGQAASWQQLSGHGGGTATVVRAGTGIIVQPGSGSVTVSLADDVDQTMRFRRDVNVNGNLNSTNNINAGDTVTAPMATFGAVDVISPLSTFNVDGRTTLNQTTIDEGLEVTGPTVVQRAIVGNEPVTLDQLNEAESRIINRAREEFELEPEIDPGHEFRYIRTFENTDDNTFDSGASMIPVTLPIGTIVNNTDFPNGEVNIIYPTTGRGAGSRSSTGRRLSGTLYTSPGNVTRSAGGVDIPYNSSEAGDTRLIGTAYAGYRPRGTPQIEQELWRHDEMWAAADFEITLKFRHATDAPDSDPRTLTQRWSDIRMNFECWNHNILYHHRSIEGNTNGGDEAITAGPLLNYFAGAIGLQRTVPGGTQTAMPPGMATYMNRGSDGNLFEQTYDGGYVPGSYISIAPNISLTSSGNDNEVHTRLQTNQSARNFQEFGSDLPDQGNQDMRPLIFTAIPCPWRIISDAIDHVYIQNNPGTRQFPVADVAEITDSGMFSFTRAEHRNFPLEGEPRYMEPLDTSESRTNAPLIPEVYIEVGTAFGQILDMELEFNMSNVRYVNSITQDGGSRVASTTIASMLPRGTGNQIHNARTSIWATGQANTGGVGGGRENTALPPAIFKELTIVGNRPEPVSYNPYAVRTGNGIDVFDYGFLYGGNTLAHQLRAFRAEQTIMPVTHAQAFTGNWVIGDYELAAGTFGAFDQTNTGAQDSQGRHLLMTSRYSRPDPYNTMTSHELFPSVANKLGRHPEQWSSARAADASNPYQAGEVVRSTGFTFALPTTPVADREEDPTRLRLWVARRNARVSGGEIVEADRQGPAHSFENDVFGDPLWFPLSVHAQLAMPVIPIQEDGLRPLSGLEAQYTPGNYTRGRPPTFPGDFEDYEINGLPVYFSQQIAGVYGETDLRGTWAIRDDRPGDRTNIPSGQPRAGQLGRFNPDVFHFRKSANTDPISFAFDPPRGSTGTNDSANPAFVFVANEEDDQGNDTFTTRALPTGYIDPYVDSFLPSYRISSDNAGDASMPNTLERGDFGLQQTALRAYDGKRGVLHAIPQSNLRPTGVHNRGTSNTQELYMPHLAVVTDTNGDLQWRAPAVAQPREAPSSGSAGGDILPPFGWQDHSDFIQIDYRNEDNDDPPMNTRYTILEWRPEDGFFRISRVADGSDTSTATEEAQWTDTDAPFRNIARYVLGRRAGVDFLQAGSDPATRVAGEVSVIERNGIQIGTAAPLDWNATLAYRENTYVSYTPTDWDPRASYNEREIVRYQMRDYQALADIPAPAMSSDPDNTAPDMDTTRWRDDGVNPVQYYRAAQDIPANPDRNLNPRTARNPDGSTPWERQADDYDREQLFVGVDASALQAGPPNDILENVMDTGNPLPFGMFGLIDLFLGQQFSNEEDGTEQPANRANTDFDFFERYRRRGTSYYWFPNRGAVVRADGRAEFLTVSDTGTPLGLKAPAVFEDVANIATTPIPRSETLIRPDRGTFFTNEVRLTWGGTVNGERVRMAPAFTPGRYYIMYGTTNAGLDVQWFFSSSAVTRTDTFNWFINPQDTLLAYGPDNEWTSGGQNLNQTTMNEIALLSIPEDDYRLFEGIWQNYVGRNVPDTQTGQWRALLEG